MKKFGTKQIVPLGIAAICGVFLFAGLRKFGFWNAAKKSPTPAFVPSIICVLLIVICLITVITSLRKEDGTAVYYKEELLVIAAAAAIIGCTYIFGMLPTLALFVILWLKLVEKASWKTVVIILLIVMAIVIGVFVLWLGVRFPNGLIYNAIVNR